MPKAEMSKSNVENGIDRIKAEKIFTDREEPRASFWNAYEEIVQDIENFKVLTYYGIGGIGKTTLMSKLAQEMDSKNVKYVSLNFERYESLSKVLILRDFGRKLFQLDKNQFKFYRFRFAIKRYAEETGQSLEIKNDTSSFLTNNPLIELGLDLSESIPDMIEKLPIISTISKAITILDKSREIIKNEIDTRNMKKSLIEIQTLEIQKLLDNLDKYFYEDLSEAMLDAKQPLVILLDTYEKFADTFSNIEYISTEKWLKNIVSKPQGILWVIAGREKINWESEFEAEHHLLENLAYRDAKEFLITASVNEELIDGIYELTSGNPVFLDVCVDRNIELINNGGIPTIKDFGESQTKLIERYAKYMDKDVREMAYLLAYLGKWKTEDILKIKEKTNIVKLSITDYNDFIGHSFVIKDNDTFYMTKIVQKVFFENMPDVLKNEFHKLNYSCIEENIAEGKEEISYVEDVTLLVNEFLKGQPSATETYKNKLVDILENISVLYDKGQLNQELILSSKIYDYYANKDQTYDELKLLAMNRLAIAYKNIGNYTKALDLTEEIYFEREKTLGENHLDTINVLNNLAVLYENIGDNEFALEIIEEVYEKRKNILGENHSDTLNALNNLAALYSNIGNYNKALELRKEIYIKGKGVLGENHPNTLSMLNNLANSYYDIGDYTKALELRKEAYEEEKNILGENHPDTLSMLNNLANSYDDIGDYAKALELSKTVYEKRKDILGENHPNTLRTLNNLAISYENIRDYTKALELIKEAYEKKKDILGENHPDTLCTLDNLASLYGYIEDYTKPIEIFKEVYEKRKKVLGENHPDTLRTLSNLAISYGNIKNFRKSLELLKEANEKQELVLGKNHPDTLRTLKGIIYIIKQIDNK